MVDKKGRYFLARFGVLWVVAGDFRATRLLFPIRRTFKNDGERPGNGLPCGRGAIDIGRCFTSVDSPSDCYPKFVAIDEEAQHQIVHRYRFGETNRATHEPL